MEDKHAPVYSYVVKASGIWWLPVHLRVTLGSTIAAVNGNTAAAVIHAGLESPPFSIPNRVAKPLSANKIAVIWFSLQSPVETSVIRWSSLESVGFQWTSPFETDEGLKYQQLSTKELPANDNTKYEGINKLSRTVFLPWAARRHRGGGECHFHCLQKYKNAKPETWRPPAAPANFPAAGYRYRQRYSHIKVIGLMILNARMLNIHNLRLCVCNGVPTVQKGNSDQENYCDLAAKDFVDIRRHSTTGCIWRDGRACEDARAGTPACVVPYQPSNKASYAQMDVPARAEMRWNPQTSPSHRERADVAGVTNAQPFIMRRRPRPTSLIPGVMYGARGLGAVCSKSGALSKLHCALAVDSEVGRSGPVTVGSMTKRGSRTESETSEPGLAHGVFSKILSSGIVGRTNRFSTQEPVLLVNHPAVLRHYVEA
ncbi:hypothetical protein B0H11DRAFT_1907451 [Mycena galericulata]|nr:hypothetical protein B0H11DRAFT_1907451 [Mycena galericulata]